MLRRLWSSALLLLLLWGGWVSLFPLSLPQTPFEFDLKNGLTLRQVAHELQARHVLWEPWSFTLLGRVLGRQTHIKAGSYEWNRPLSALQILDRLTSGDSLQNEARLVEGMSFSQVRTMLATNPQLRPAGATLSEADLLHQIGLPYEVPEGLFFPDTYFFNPGDSDLDLLKRAANAMSRRLQRAWLQRAQGLPYQTPYQALIMASIIEKESARAEERPLIAAVFINRLRLGMRLQTDPTVIYGMGTHYHGNIHKKDLLTDTPYNTYTRAGLPPTPIAMPGQGAIDAALHPATTQALYFVAKGDGSHQFSDTLAQHNRAVQKYQIHPHIPEHDMNQADTRVTQP